MRKLLAAIIAVTLAPAAALAQANEPAPFPDPLVEAAQAQAQALAQAPVGTNPAQGALAPGATPASIAADGAREAGGTAATATSTAADRQRKPFRVGLSLGNSMGSGTVTGDPYFAYVGSSLSISPSYAFEVAGVKLNATGSLSGSYEFTNPNNNLGRHWNYNDIGLGLSAGNLYKDKLTGITVSPNLGATLPIGLDSLFRGTITSLSGGVGLGRQFGKFSLGGRVGASKTFYSEITRTLNDKQRSRRDDMENLIFLCRASETECGLRGVPSLWALSGGLSASYQVLPKLGVSMGINMSKRWAYAVSDGLDEYASRAVDSNGNRVASSQGQMDTMMGNVGVSYRITDTINASFGYAVAQMPKTADNKRFRFPWYSPYYTGGYTSYTLGLSTAF